MSLIAISGKSGLVGSALSPFLQEKGYEVVSLNRSSQQEGILWNPEKKEFQAEKLEGAHAVIHLAGYSVAKRWSAKVKKEIESSRVDGTRLLVEGLGTLKNPPKVLICASAVGYYGDGGDQILTEKSAKGNFFLSDVVEKWEKEAKEAEKFGIRVVLLRFGVILSTRGGALKKMLLPFKMGLGGPISHGRQWMPWISLQDTLRVIVFLLEKEEAKGAFNVVTPQPVTNKEFGKILGKVLHRPAIFPLPGFQAKLIFGEMAKELLLASIRSMPNRLQELQFSFEEPDLKTALTRMIAEKT